MAGAGTSREPTPSALERERKLRQQRRNNRVPVAGKLRLVADTADGLMTLSGHVIDLSTSGCALRIWARLEPDIPIRLELTLGRDVLWLPGRVMWVKARAGAWICGVQFDRVVPTKQAALLRLLAARS